jgi:hypothetical protein
MKCYFFPRSLFQNELLGGLSLTGACWTSFAVRGEGVLCADLPGLCVGVPQNGQKFAIRGIFFPQW